MILYSANDRDLPAESGLAASATLLLKEERTGEWSLGFVYREEIRERASGFPEEGRRTRHSQLPRVFARTIDLRFWTNMIGKRKGW